MTDHEFLNEIAHSIKETADKFRGVEMYIRKRRDCPSREPFSEGITILDKTMEKIFKRMREENEQSK